MVPLATTGDSHTCPHCPQHLHSTGAPSPSKETLTSMGRRVKAQGGSVPSQARLALT